jgi:PST family polysaccharide transporter
VIIPAVFPVFSRLQNDRDRLKDVFLKGSKLMSILVFPIFLGVAALGPELITTLFGYKWSPSFPVVQILAFVGLLQAFLSLNGSLVIALGRPVELLKIRILSSIVILLAFIIAVRWGIVAVALSYAVANFVVIAPFHFRLVLRVTALSMRKYFGQFGIAATASTLMVITIFALKYFLTGLQAHYGQILMYIFTAMIVYITTSLLMWPSLFTQLAPSSWREQ